MNNSTYTEKVYAGVLGKIIGVYLGRPVEGWSYEKITETFGEVPFYVHKECKVPLIVADDDISGTFGFFRTMEDTPSIKDLTAQDVGNTWLNYIIEDKTILWWGGLGRSTEHTAYLNLKNGITAPQSGSIKQNGRTLAEQIGAQIFIDAFAMACPGNPELAVNLVRKAASVSHDGLAVDAACYLGAMQAMAFDEKNMDKLLDNGMAFVSNPVLVALIEDVRNICAGESNWRVVRSKLNDKYGYHIYPGCCHMVPNHAMVLASLILGGDDFQKSIKIASSAAWDTDCNAGNVGALNGIRLGLEGISQGADFRTPVADKMLVVTAEGGETISDAVRETYRIVKVAARLQDKEIVLPASRFHFSLPGSVQGFTLCPYTKSLYGGADVLNGNDAGFENGLLLRCKSVAQGAPFAVSTPTFIDFKELAKNFSTIASPTLYEGQTVCVKAENLSKMQVSVQPYILHYNLENEICRVEGPLFSLGEGPADVSWKIPSVGGMPIFRFGLQLVSTQRFQGDVLIRSIDWKKAPELFQQQGMLMTSIWNTNPYWTKLWASSAKAFAADFKYTYCVSHPEENGLVTLGTRDWENYSISSKLCFALHKTGGLVVRSRGHRQYYGGALTEYGKLILFKQQNNKRTVLAKANFSYEEDVLYPVKLQANGNHLQLFVNGQLLLEANDDTFASGGAGFIIENGTMTVDGVSISQL